jgi:DMSO/TMAO reductase YedYZ molybdopterin-dependent catalytic subunit
VLLLAGRLNGAKLTPDHGAPPGLVAPMHYGYKSVEHLTVLEYRRSYTTRPAGWKEHPRGRVMQEERSRLLPGAIWRRAWAAALPAARRPYRTASTST